MGGVEGRGDVGHGEAEYVLEQECRSLFRWESLDGNHERGRDVFALFVQFGGVVVGVGLEPHGFESVVVALPSDGHFLAGHSAARVDTVVGGDAVEPGSKR